MKNEVCYFNDFMEPRKTSVFAFVKWELLVLILPLTVIATILFYVANNPELRDTEASVSWLCLFLVRNIITMTMAKGTEVYIIDYLSLRKRFTVRIFGPVFALLVVQSRGYPAIFFFWGLYSLLLLCGYYPFVKHWLFYQKAIQMCNANNPAGKISESRIYVDVLGCALLFGAAVSIKRLWLGLKLGERAYCKFSPKLQHFFGVLASLIVHLTVLLLS